MDSKSQVVPTSLPSPPPPPPPSSPRPPSPPRPWAATTSVESEESEELQRLVHAPPFWKSKRKLCKQLSMCENASPIIKSRDIAWEKRRRQILRQERKKNVQAVLELEDHHNQQQQQQRGDLSLTDEDWRELKGSIELGFGFNEEAGQYLCNTLPALDLYLAVNRQLSPSPGTTPRSQGSSSNSPMKPPRSSIDSPRSEDSWKICSPGDDPQQVKTKLRHWAQAVACSVRQSF